MLFFYIAICITESVCVCVRVRTPVCVLLCVFVVMHVMSAQ